MVATSRVAALNAPSASSFPSLRLPTPPSAPAAPSFPDYAEYTMADMFPVPSSLPTVPIPAPDADFDLSMLESFFSAPNGPALTVAEASASADAAMDAYMMQFLPGGSFAAAGSTSTNVDSDGSFGLLPISAPTPLPLDAVVGRVEVSASTAQIQMLTELCLKAEPSAMPAPGCGARISSSPFKSQGGASSGNFGVEIVGLPGHAEGSSVRTSATIRQVPSLASQPTQGNESVDTEVPSATIPGQEHIAYELDLAEYARELRESDDPLATWARDDREAYLAELLRFEGRGAHQYLLCRECGSEPAVFRCRDCLDGGILRCRACFVAAHKYLPFHRPQVTNLQASMEVEPVLRKVLPRLRTGRAKDSALAGLRGGDPVGIMAPSRTFQHLQVTPFLRHPQELVITILPITMNMGPGSRRDALNDFFNDQNHKKTIILGQTMLRKVMETAPLVIETQQALLDLEGGFLPDTIKVWTDMAVAWEAAASERVNSHPNPFESSGKATFLAGVQRQLAEEAAEREQAGTETVGAVRNGMHVTELIAGGLQLEEQQRSLNADTAALGAHATDRQRTALVERSTKLRRKIGAWMEMQLQFFPDVERLRLEDDQARAQVAASQSQAVPGVRAGDMQLWLPSAIYPRAVGSHTRLGCTDEILTFEFQMRVGEANEALSTVRRLLLLCSHLYSQKDRNVSGVRANTRSNTRIKVLEERIRRAVAQYQAAWRALRVLGTALNRVDWEVDLRELKADDVRGIPRTHFADPARQRGARSAAPSIDHGAEGVDAAPSQSKRARGTGATNSGLSWIWVRQTESRNAGDPEDMDEALRIEWARTRARAMRWSEELDLLEEEMRRILQYLQWRAHWWESRRALRENSERSEAQIEGENAYALRQAALQRALRDSFEREWEKLPAFIADARRRAGLLPFQQQDDGGGPGEEAQLHDADAPVPLGPPGAVFLPAAD
ncbi:hypothetical protein MKEN_01317000 [Mycena kentingensis (nom. inval.)]|nr:hypothetical protein MKEN_01317000 [Mycena kentingensis (nom. inval.)]